MKKDLNIKFRKFAGALEKIDAEQIYIECVKQTEDLALDLNRSQLYDQGVDSDNRPLGKYAESTKKKKSKDGQRSDHITLNDTDGFYDKMFLNTKQIPILIDSKDYKTPILLGKFPKALGLTSTNKSEFGRAVLIEYKHKIATKVEALKEKILS